LNFASNFLGKELENEIYEKGLRVTKGRVSEKEEAENEVSFLEWGFIYSVFKSQKFENI